MGEVLTQLEGLSIEELQELMNQIPALIEKKEAEEAERIAREKAEAERLERERQKLAEIEMLKQRLMELEQEVAGANQAKEEEARIAREKAEAEEAERIAQEKAEAERLEAERIAREKAEAEEAARIAQEKAEAERIAKAQAEAEALEAARLAQEEAERKAKEKAANLMPCPCCAAMIAPNSRFCGFCGTDVANYVPPKAPEIPKTPEMPKTTQTWPSDRPSIGEPGPGFDAAQVRYADESEKKWKDDPGEEVLDKWRNGTMTKPDGCAKYVTYMKITNKRIQISREGHFKAGMRTGAVGAIGNALIQKGNPWVEIPLGAISEFRLEGKQKIIFYADQEYEFVVFGAKNIYEALQKMIPHAAR